jgi:hypothetical protein
MVSTMIALVTVRPGWSDKHTSFLQCDVNYDRAGDD